MSEQNQLGSAKDNRPKAKVARVAEQTGAEAELAQLPPGRIGAEAAGGRDDLDALSKGPGGVLGGGSLENQVARLSDPRLRIVQRQVLATEIGRVQGNRHLQRIIASINHREKPVSGQVSSPVGPEKSVYSLKLTPSSLARIERIARGAVGDPGIHIAFAGSPVRQNAPGGLGTILSRSGTTNLGSTGGLTLIKSAAAFTPPSFSTSRVSIRRGHRVEHFAVVQPTTSTDAVHDSYYPGPGNHLRPGMTQRIGGTTFRYYWWVSPQMSSLIRHGEQEHLDDALRAYMITYKLIENEINALAGQRFGPAQTPAGADQLAEAALASRLPRQLGANPADWVRMLDMLLRATQIRDAPANAWHAVYIGPPRTRGNMMIYPVLATNTTRIGQVPPSQVVNYPAVPAGQPVPTSSGGTSARSPVGDFPEPRRQERLA